MNAERLWEAISEGMGPEEKRIGRRVLFSLTVVLAQLAQTAKEDLER